MEINSNLFSRKKDSLWRDLNPQLFPHQLLQSHAVENGSSSPSPTGFPLSTFLRCSNTCPQNVIWDQQTFGKNPQHIRLKQPPHPSPVLCVFKTIMVSRPSQEFPRGWAEHLLDFIASACITLMRFLVDRNTRNRWPNQVFWDWMGWLSYPKKNIGQHKAEIGAIWGKPRANHSPPL